jgi:hypothetical protein
LVPKVFRYGNKKLAGYFVRNSAENRTKYSVQFLLSAGAAKKESPEGLSEQQLAHLRIFASALLD